MLMFSNVDVLEFTKVSADTFWKGPHEGEGILLDEDINAQSWY